MPRTPRHTLGPSRAGWTKAIPTSRSSTRSSPAASGIVRGLLAPAARGLTGHGEPVAGYLLDTNVISELFKKRPSPKVLESVRSTRGQDLATSVLCVVELRYGASRHRKGEAIWERISSHVLSRIRILPLGWQEAVRAGDILGALERRGEPIGIEDVLIAATALEHGLTVVTRNSKHFSRIEGLLAESWWDR